MLYQSDYLIEFAMVAREQSFTRAALLLNVSQPTLSRHVRSLETSMGLQLLERHADGVCLTPDGLEIYTKAAAIIEALDQIDCCVARRRQPSEISVCGLEVFPRYCRVFTDRLKRFSWQGRPVECRLMRGCPAGAADHWSAVCDGLVTLFVLPRLAGAGTAPEGLTCRSILRGQTVAAMDANHPLASRARLEAHDLQGAVLIHAESNYHYARQWWAALKPLLRAAQVDYLPDSRLLRDDTDYFCDFGSGILLLPEGYKVSEMLKSTGKVLVPVEGLNFSLDAVFRSDDELARTVATLDYENPAV